jgi:hypothetical protein
MLIDLAVFALLASPPEVTAEPRGEGSVIRVRNTGTQHLTAFLVEIVDYPGNEFGMQWDEGCLETVAPGAEKQVVVESMMPGTVPDYLRVRAGVYADGSTFGEASKVNQIVSSRRLRLKLTRDLIDRVEKGRSGTRESLWSDLKSVGQSNRIAGGILRRLHGRSADEMLVVLRREERTLADCKAISK